MVVVQKYTQTIQALENLPATLRETRRVRGVSIRDMADQAGIDKMAANRLEHGRFTVPTALAVMRWIEKA